MPDVEAMRTDALNNKLAWLVPSKTWNRLHYMPGVDSETWEHWWDNTDGDGHTLTAACGSTFVATLPGFMSRMGAPRCKRCCSVLGVPDGDGAPVNDSRLRSLR